MKKIRIDFVGFWPSFNKEKNFICDMLRKSFEIEISSNPDFLFASVFGEPYKFMDYDCVRILYTGEPFVPDFNVFDYAIGFDRISLTDQYGENRYYRYPYYMIQYDQLKRCSGGLNRSEAEMALKKKKFFCNFLYSHASGNGMRERIFESLQAYKRVESAGYFLNNQPDGKIIPYSDKKIDYLKQCKFTIACESMSYPGFITEKIIDSFLGDSIPVYYGDALCEIELNPSAFINLHRYKSWDDALKRIVEVDENDELYIKMLMEPKFSSADYLANTQQGLEDFLVRILLQDRDDAFRRPMYFNRQTSWLKNSRKFIRIAYPVKNLGNKAEQAIWAWRKKR